MSQKSKGGAKPLILIAIVAVVALGAYSIRNPGGWLGQLFKQGDNMPSQTHASRIQHADDATFEQVVLKSEVPVLVDFYADWCPPCRALAPLLEDVANEATGVKVVKLNVDKSPGVATRYGVSSIPTLIVFKAGAPANQSVGLVDRDQLRSLLEL